MSDTTNDEQAPYGKFARMEAIGVNADGTLWNADQWYAHEHPNMDKPTERAPLLSDKAIQEWRDREHWIVGTATGATHARNWYEAKITSGEQRVNTRVENRLTCGAFHCPSCHGMYPPNMNFCPDCGAQIVKA
jgi:hypothetical protein